MALLRGAALRDYFPTAAENEYPMLATRYSLREVWDYAFPSGGGETDRTWTEHVEALTHLGLGILTAQRLAYAVIKRDT